MKRLTELNAKEITKLYPYAVVLASLDGNCYIQARTPEFDLVSQYIPDLYEVLGEELVEKIIKEEVTYPLGDRLLQIAKEREAQKSELAISPKQYYKRVYDADRSGN